MYLQTEISRAFTRANYEIRGWEGKGLILFLLKLGPGQTSIFTWVELNTNELKQKTSLAFFLKKIAFVLFNFFSKIE